MNVDLLSAGILYPVRHGCEFSYISKHRVLGTKHSLTGANPCNPHYYLKGKMPMSNRNIEIKVRLNRKEAEALAKRVKRSGLSREAYIRQLINGFVPRDAPPPDYYGMMRQLYKIGANLNQIAQKAHVLNVIDVQRYDAGVRVFEDAVKTITKAVVLPMPMNK